MKQSQRWFRDNLNHEMRLASPAELGAEIGSKVFYGGLLDEVSGDVHPAKYVFGLATAVCSTIPRYFRTISG